MKRSMIVIPVSVLLIALMIGSFFLMNIKPDTSHITKAQKLAEYSKPAVVRIVDYAVVEWDFLDYNPDVSDYLQQMNNQTIIGGTGSGAIISLNGYIVTNAHVVEFSKMDDEQIVYAAFEQMIQEISNYFQVDINVVYDYMIEYTKYVNIKRGLKVVLPSGDVLDGEIKSYGAPINEGKDVAVLKIEGKNFPTLKLGNSDRVQNQDNIWVIGYPAAADSDLLSPDSSLVSSMNTGHISAASKKTEQGSPVIQIDAAATHGNSGGPVINENGEIIGLLTFRGDTVNGQEVQGFNFAVPVNTVKEFVKQAGADNTRSNTDKLFKEGLELYWGGYYGDALKKFEAVERIYPNHSEIKRFITESQQKSKESKILWSNYQTLFFVFDGIALLIIVALMLFGFILKPKKKEVAVTNSSIIPDLNEDGKVDIQDILIALQKQQNKQDNNDEK
ncbi:S1C family serine protease [Anoxybacillus salavatliensis]|uniref:S1C family serine protease n=1 Tax=Anoxybacillus gonensis TaxID=198467 RepID=UPI00214B604C|nr:S1C family serine protease [Anoxybacillus gonensis]MCQ5364799.1 S1C family serine protease [Anoxybacillus gonensis]